MADINGLKEAVIRDVDARRDQLMQIADTIHAHPEIAFEETEAAALLSRTLEEIKRAFSEQEAERAEHT